MAFTWPIDRSSFPALPATDAENYAEALAVQNGAEDLAVQILWALSGRQFGINTVTVRPCRKERSFGTGTGGWRRGYDYGDYSYGEGGLVTSYVLSWEGEMGWVNLPCGCIGGQCRVSGPRLIHLAGPAQTIDNVTINGAELDPSLYSLEGNSLFRIGGIWPFQDLSKPTGEFGTWSVTYEKGIPVPDGVAQLTGQLTLEMLNAVTAPSKCRLPRNVVAVTRNGVSYQVYDPTTFYAAGKTGMPEIDLWLMGVNPNHIQQAPSVL